MLEVLVSALRDARSRDGALDSTKAFLADETALQEFARKIEQGEQRDRFLSILTITPAVYDDLRTILNKKSLPNNLMIVARQGRRGGLHVITPAAPSVVPQIDKTQEKEVEKESKEVDDRELRLEKEYYPLVKAWAEQAGFSATIITGGLLPGYRWENPDLISVDYTISKYDKTIMFDIVSFEVKLRIDPYAVWQAAHYKRFSSQGYVAFAKGADEIREQNDGRVFELAVELGLGVLSYNAEKRGFEEIQSPRKETPDNVRTMETIERFSSVIEDVIKKAIWERAV